MVTREEIELIQLLTQAVFPGAVEARAYEFIVRDMKSNTFMIEIYRNGFAQLEKGAQELFRMSLHHLSEGQLHNLLVRHENIPFFKFLRNHTMEGIFSDPIYGGNYQTYGWRLVGFAGAEGRILGRELSDAGLSVCVLKRGSMYETKDITMDELRFVIREDLLWATPKMGGMTTYS